MKIVDALIVTLSLDASGYKKGQKEATEALKKTRDEAVKSGKDIESAGAKAAESFATLTRNVATLFGVILSSKALYEFLTSLNEINAATGRMAQSLGSTPEALSTWGQAVERLGGSSTEAVGSVGHLIDEFNELKTTGQSAILPWLGKLQALGGVKFDISKPITEQMGALADNLKRIYDKDPAMAFFFGKKLGLDEGSIRLLVQGRAAVAQALADAKGLAITKEQAEAAMKLSRVWTEILQTIRLIGRDILEFRSPVIQKALEVVRDILEDIREAFILIQDVMKEAERDIVEFLRAAGEKFAKFVGDISGAGPKILDAIKNAFAEAIKWIEDQFNRVWRAVTGHNLFSSTSAHSAGGARGEGNGGGGRGDDRPIIGGRVRHARGNLAANQQEAYNAARAEGLSDQAARALVANMSGESLANPRDYHWDSRHMSQGIVQWDPQRAEAIRQKFGKYPKDMTVAEQTRAAIWEINTNGHYARTSQALKGGNAQEMIRALVENYERPADTRGAISTRYGFLQGLPRDFGAKAAANISNTSSVANTSSETHIGPFHVNTQASDGPGVARDLQKIITNTSFAHHLNYGAN